MKILIKDSMGHKTVEFKPMREGRVKLFVCGPTVYNLIHIGNARLFIVFDAFAKFLRSQGFEVFYVQNITDIDDKIIKEAKEENKPWKEIVARYLSQYFKDTSSLGIDSVSLFARATNYIEEIIDQIKRLMLAGVAYETTDGVYFEVSKFTDYGRLSGQQLDKIRPGARVEISEDKRSPSDFVLWKKMKPGEPYWESPWGKGRPGWHIEDTAITEALFGPEYDIHGGGSDLIFPHHEAEIAQMRSLSKSEYLSRYWMHVAMLNMKEDKMSKSLGNIITVADALKKHSVQALRFFMLNTSFDSPLHYSEESLAAAEETVSRISEFYRKLDSARGSGKAGMVDVKRSRDAFMDAMANGFDTHAAMTVVLDLVTEMNRTMDRIGTRDRKEGIEFMNEVDSILGIVRKIGTGKGSEIVEKMISARNEARKKGSYALSDELRSILLQSGVAIQDNGPDTEWWFT